MSRLHRLVNGAQLRARRLRQVRSGTPSGHVRQDGVLVPLDDPMVTARIRQVLEWGQYEMGDVAALKGLHTPDDVIMEVGGGLGFMSTLASRLVGEERVFTYEANPAMLDTIKRVHELNSVAPTVTIAAMTTGGGTVRLARADDFWDRRVGADGDGPVDEVAGADFATELERVRPSFILMDVEGSEASLLGDVPLPAFVRKLAVELHPELIGDEACSAVVRSMLEQGFVLRFELSAGSIWAFERS